VRRHVYKLFFAWQFEEEEKWLNRMSAMGLQLVGVGFCRYVFEDGQPGEYLYRIELLNNLPTHAESMAYLRFLEDEMGVEHVGSWVSWVYLRRRAADGPFDLYSDLESRLRHYRRILALFAGLVPLAMAGVHRLPDLLSNWPDHILRILITLLPPVLLAPGLISIWHKVKRLERERAIRE
jgi:hypothetical protein